METILFYFTYAPKGDQAALDTAKEWTNDPLWKNLNAVKSGNVHEVSDATWNTAGGVLAANIMLDDLEKILLKEISNFYKKPPSFFIVEKSEACHGLALFVSL